MTACATLLTKEGRTAKMIDNLKKLLSSKKFKVLAATIIGILVSALAQGKLTPEQWNHIVTLVAVYLGAQGLADIGKYRQ